MRVTRGGGERERERKPGTRGSDYTDGFPTPEIKARAKGLYFQTGQYAVSHIIPFPNIRETKRINNGRENPNSTNTRLDNEPDSGKTDHFYSFFSPCVE